MNISFLFLFSLQILCGINSFIYLNMMFIDVYFNIANTHKFINVWELGL